MILITPIDITRMTPHQQAWFQAEYQRARKDEVAGLLFALFLGVFGVHHFYLHRNGLGVLYIFLGFLGISPILGFIECFFMPGRVRAYNAALAGLIAGGILADASAHAPAGSTGPRVCRACGTAFAQGATFCPHCGAAAANAPGLQLQP